MLGNVGRSASLVLDEPGSKWAGDLQRNLALASVPCTGVDSPVGFVFYDAFLQVLNFPLQPTQLLKIIQPRKDCSKEQVLRCRSLLAASF